MCCCHGDTLALIVVIAVACSFDLGFTAICLPSQPPAGVCGGSVGVCRVWVCEGCRYVRGVGVGGWVRDEGVGG